MADAQTWREFREKFTALGALANGEIWAFDLAGDGEWHLQGGADDDLRRFRGTALACARLVARNRTAQATWADWLSRIQSEAALDAWVDRSKHAPAILRINDVCAASAECCALLAAGASALSPAGAGRAEISASQPPVSWADVEINILSDTRVQVSVGKRPGESMNFAELGFGDGRLKDGVPTKAWGVFLRMASDGRIRKSGIGGREVARLEKRIEEIRAVLRRIVNSNEDPIRLSSGYYEPNFRLLKSPAAEC